MKEPLKAKSGDKEPEITYQDARDELERIIAEIESGDADVDVLSEKVKRALFLIRYCRTRLRQTDEEVRKLISGFEDDQE
jgi:exodeoxyribonuclease VII small subunit